MVASGGGGAPVSAGRRVPTAPGVVAAAPLTVRTRPSARWLLALPFAVLVVVALVGPAMMPHDPSQTDLAVALVPPVWQDGGNADYPLGTDHLGRDILSRLIFGTRVSLLVAGAALLVSLTIGTLVGLVAGYASGRLDAVLMRLTDLALSLPPILVALAIVAALSGGIRNVVIVIALTSWAASARVLRGEALRLREREFVEAARLLGASHPRIILRHILPNVLNTILVLGTLQVGALLIYESSLSFLGLGVPVETPSWGAILADGRRYLTNAWWIATLAGLVIMLTCLSFNLLGDRLRDHFDPRRRRLVSRG